MPIELSLAQLPERMEHQGRILSIRFIPIYEKGKSDEDIKEIMMVASDISELVEAEKQELRKAEQMEAFRWVMRDKRSFFESFLKEAKLRLEGVLDESFTVTLRKRELHTLKGNSSIFGFKRLASACHDVEHELHENGGECFVPSSLQRLQAQWDDLQELVAPLFENQGDSTSSSLVVRRSDYESLLKKLEDLESEQQDMELSSIVQQWTWQPTALYLERLAEQTRALATRLDLQIPDISIDDQGLRLAPERWEEFFGSAIHLVRNALGHGIESSDERKLAEKPAAGRIEFSAREQEGALITAIADDGRGIDWMKVRCKAEELGLPLDDLEEVLFHDGMSTAEEVTDISGRGVGMSAVLGAAEALGGKVSIHSTLGEGCRFEFIFPFADSVAAPVQSTVDAVPSPAVS